MKRHVMQAFEDIARHSEGRVWPALLNFCALAASRGSITEADTEEVYAIVRKAYDRKLKRWEEPHPDLRKLHIERIKAAINSGSK